MFIQLTNVYFDMIVGRLKQEKLLIRAESIVSAKASIEGGYTEIKMEDKRTYFVTESIEYISNRMGAIVNSVLNKEGTTDNHAVLNEEG